MKTNHTNKIIAIIMIILFSKFNYAQVDPAIIWQKTYGGSFDDFIIQSVETKSQTNDGGCIIGVTTASDSTGDIIFPNKGLFDFWILKLNTLGNIEWQKRIGGAGYDYFTTIKQDIDGTYIAYGSSTSDISGDKTENARGQIDNWILKLDASGNILWQKTIGGSLHDQFPNLLFTPDGGYILACQSISPISGDKTEDNLGSFYDLWVLKLDSVGNIQWQNTINANSWENRPLISMLPDGSYILACTSNSNISGDKTENSNGESDIWIMKLDASGNFIWQNTIGGSLFEDIRTMMICTDGGILLGCSSSSPISGDKTAPNIGGNDYWVVKLSSSGALLWDKSFGGVDEDFIKTMEETPTGDFLIGGHSLSNNSSTKLEDSKGGNDFWIVKIDSIGNKIWDNTIGGNGGDELCNLDYLPDGNILLFGYSSSNISSDKSENSRGTVDIWVMKIREPNQIIHGNVYADLNHSCIYDSTNDISIPYKIIHETQSGANVISELNGNYHMMVFSDTACIYISNLSIGESPNCIAIDTLCFYFDSTSSIDTFYNDFALTGDSCSQLHVDIASNTLRLCRYSTFTVNYYNDGYDTARNAFVYIQVDTSILDSFGSSLPFIFIGDSLYFDIGDVASFEYNSFSFFAHVKCSTIIGTSACTKAFVYPISTCTPPGVGYDSSDIVVETTCNDDTVHVVLKNHGSNMANPGIITAIDDEIIQRIDPYILIANATIQFDYFVGVDKTLTLKINQNSFHPQRPIIILHDELCALTTPVKLNSVINHFSRYDEKPRYEEVCSQILGSFDPNMKSVVPQGYTSQHYTDSNQVLEYRIDFQNTGLDTAFKVVIIDTLSPWLNINTFVPSVSSHTCRTELEGSHTLKFIFDPISLPDSNASEPNSHGYVTFKIRPQFNTPKGTLINNFADIYFDYNTPVRTNTIFNTIYDTVLVRLGLGLNEPKENLEAQVLVFPNPTIDKFFIKLDKEIVDAQIKLVDISGREVYEMNHVNGTQIEMKAIDLSKGIYFINIYDKNNMIARSKIIVQ